LTKRIAEKLEWTHKQGTLSVDAFVMCVMEGLQRDNRVQIPGFGTFTLRHKKPRVARNPRTGEPVEVPAKKSVGFKVSDNLKKYINEEDE